MVIGPGRGGIAAFVILADGELLPENLNSEKVLVMRKGDSTNRELKVVKELGKLATPDLLKKPEEPVCEYLFQLTEGNPLHEHKDGTWWFYEETWAFENGPFPTYEEAEAALEAYCIVVVAVREEQEEISKKGLTTNLEDGTVKADENTELHPDIEGTGDASGDGPSKR
jgi:hypothetical protein